MMVMPSIGRAVAVAIMPRATDMCASANTTYVDTHGDIGAGRGRRG